MRWRRTKPLMIGISPRIGHPEPGAKGLRSRTLQILEQSVAHWVMSRDVMVFMLPTLVHDGAISRSAIRLSDYVDQVDGLVLQGGQDVSPNSYGEEPLCEEWSGDKIRDAFELELLMECIEAEKPVLGVCRGCQLINVAFGGTLHQDIATQLPQAQVHNDTDLYERNFHDVRFVEGSGLARLYPGLERARINSIHHQAASLVGRDLVVEAVCEPDAVVEALRLRGDTYVFGVQWHPEFHHPGDPDTLDCTPIVDEFLAAARRRSR